MRSKPIATLGLLMLAFAITVLSADYCAAQADTHQATGKEGQVSAERPVDNSLPAFDRSWDYANPVKTEAYFRSLLAPAEALGETDYMVQLWTQIARAQGVQGDREAQRRTLDEVRTMLTPETKVARIRYHLEMGRLLSREQDKEGARENYLKAWNLGRAEGQDDFAIDAAHMLGLTEKPRAALAWDLKALELAQSTLDPRARNWAGPLYNNLGWLHYRNGLYRKALDWFDRGNAWFTERRMNRDALRVRWSRGITLRKLKRFDEALAVQQNLETQWNKTGQMDARVLEEIGACMLALGRREEAKPYFARAYKEYIGRYRISDDERKRIENIRILGGLKPDGTPDTSPNE